MDMRYFYPLENTVQHYDWGSADFIPRLLDKENPLRKPWAELWMGDHDRGPSSVIVDGRSRSLGALLKEDPSGFLGPDVAARYGRLPFLLKVLAAARPLSIQAHPDLEQARAGFAREHALGIAIDAPHRNYRDDNHKPEIICALTAFHALCGFRPFPEMAGLFESFGVSSLLPAGNERDDRVARLFRSLLSLDRNEVSAVLEKSSAAARSIDSPESRWVLALAGRYPQDIGALGPLFLNLVALAPHKSLYLGAGELHAYLEGAGIELMANSDNVLRGGLTAKHIDAEELFRVLRFEGREPGIETAVIEETGVYRYPSRVGEFALRRLDVAGVIEIRKGRLPEILICVDGGVTLKRERESIDLPCGGSAFVAARADAYAVEGHGTIFSARVGATGEPA